MSYHSLEDRLVKRLLTAGRDPPHLRTCLWCRPSTQPELRLMTRGAEQADEAEVADNPRAASVRVRAAERIRPAVAASSTFLNTARARTLRPGGGLPRPRLTIVPKVAVRAPRIPFALMVVTVLAAGLIGLLVLNTSLQRGAYAVTDLQDRSANLTLQQQNLETEVAALEAPQRISERAVRLGMVAGDSPAFLSLKTGEVVGVPRAGVRGKQPVIAMAGTGQPDSTRDDVHPHPAVDGRTDDTAHQRQARTAGVRGGGEPHERRGQGAQGGPPRRKARRHPTHLPRRGRHPGYKELQQQQPH